MNVNKEKIRNATHFGCFVLLKSEVEALGAPCPALKRIDTRRSWLSYNLGESTRKKIQKWKNFDK